MSFAIFDERFYLERNPDVRAAVASRSIGSALEHFQRFGIGEGRVLVSSQWNESEYLRLNPDVAAAVARRELASGLQHFILYGENERRPGAPVIVREAGFNESFYLSRNTDVAAAVARGEFASGKAHFIRNGQLETRLAVFTGTSGDDIVTGIGQQTGVVGVQVDVIASRDMPDIRPVSLGVGELDLLTGSGGFDTFILGVGRSPANAFAQRFYVGRGDGDYAYIKNFERNRDAVQLAGRPSDYNIATGGTVRVGGVDLPAVSILTNTGDRVAIVENVSSLQLTQDDPNQNIFFLA
ncbi:hypothetical protein [Microseira sp. BLCC-F43]|jgi:hypothetical protein|uniref:hypothetical protein n=1 Tax=Microseira sp. BLCC-F43 TaxID=3153602 RepID=UPI0035BB222D